MVAGPAGCVRGLVLEAGQCVGQASTVALSRLSAQITKRPSGKRHSALDALSVVT